MTAGTNLGVSTLGAIAASIRHYRQKNIHFRTFTVLAATDAAGAFIGSFLTGYFPVSLLLTMVGVIVLYESFALLKGSTMKNKKPFGNSKMIGNGSELSSDSLPDKNINRGNILVHTRKRLIILESAIGFGVGVLGGLVGLVLGSIRMPAMISILRMEPKAAVGSDRQTEKIIPNVRLSDGNRRRETLNE